MQGAPLLKSCTQCPVQAVLQVPLAAPLDDVGEQVPVEGRVLFEQGIQVQRPLGGHQVAEQHLLGGDAGPIPLVVPVLGIRPFITDALEDHGRSLRPGVVEAVPGLGA